jgi:hypothetical protein
MTHRKIDIYNEIDNFVEENEGEVTHTEIARHFFEFGRNNAIDKACEWLEDTFKDGELIAPLLLVQLKDKFRKAMKGE